MNAIIPDIPRAYTAFAEWGACVLYIIMLRRRFRGWKIAVLMLTALALQTLLLCATGDFPIGFWIPSILTAVLLMFLFILVCCNINIRDVLYYCVRAFVLAEFAASLESQVYWFFWPYGTSAFAFEILLLVVIYLAVGFIMWLLERKHIFRNQRMEINGHELWSTIIIGAVVFFMSNISFISGNTPFSSHYPRDIQNIRTLIDLGGLAILYAHHIQCCRTRDQHEMIAMQNVLQNQYNQYKLSRDSIDMINRKYHDIKYQIAALRAEKNPEKRTTWLDTMENDIKVYETQNKTGNHVLDTIFTSKSLYCQKHGISLTCVIDGALLDFMNLMDICTLFGNALDNAIECEMKIADKNKRLIHVIASKKKNFLLLRFENYFENELQFDGDLPITTKGNMDFHGYGLKNIKCTVKKYNGTMTISAEKNWFDLTIIFPLQQ